MQRVNTAYGPIEGFVDTHPVDARSSAGTRPGPLSPVRKFLGVPYARAERLKRCEPPHTWESTLKCTEFGPSFPQMTSPFDNMYKSKRGWIDRSFLGFSEDAFSVNVFAPGSTRVDRLPVMVWVYGGNLNSGSSSMGVYDPTEFVRAVEREGRPCIVVTGNYRVNAFGWLATPDLEAVNGHVGNFGLHDLIAILEWVQTNISAFGGDINNVTAWGESAGAFLLGSLLKSGRRLFHKLILQSGTYNLMAAKRAVVWPPYPDLLKNLGSDSEELTAHDRVAALRALPTQQFIEATQALFRPGMWGLIYDGAEDGWSKPLWNRVGSGEYDPWIQSVLLGINEDEGSFFNLRAQFYRGEVTRGFMKARHGFNAADIEKIHSLYPVTDGPGNDVKSLPSSHWYSDYGYLTPMIHAGTSFTAVPNVTTKKTIPVYVYLCRTIPSRLKQGYEHLGIVHTGEIPWVFKQTALWDGDKTSEDDKTSDAFSRHWSTFATEGRPGLEWPKFDPETGAMLVFEDGGRTSVGNALEFRKREREVWYEVLDKRMKEI
ncbi:alpha/beta-hydrolase [Cylindrobasidium torrendii FP15055 ss-10]|uniref:Alpha/beta-hydrolase n=1 Tax=Cylindrobasidium torrendii FP15055 ss-10 TaxID=1314674 RepID=A0A0D7BBX7_9AGAR|nr:alpha/beta-hydrolase [Cylindrobasidium torrendii FP15055 ss-10]